MQFRKWALKGREKPSKWGGEIYHSEKGRDESYL